MAFDIILKNSEELAKVPQIDDLARAELAVNHRTDSIEGLVNTSVGLFIRVGSTPTESVGDKVVRIGNAYVSSDSPESYLQESADLDYTGELWFKEDTKQFFINTTGATSGWQEVAPYATEAAKGEIQLASVDDVMVGSNDTKAVTPYKLTQWIKSNIDFINRGSSYVLYVDQSHPSSSDSMDNRGNSPFKPYRTIERALLETARRSFVQGVGNDYNLKSTIFIAPGEYTLQNGFGGSTSEPAFNRYQDGANLVLLNRDDIVQQVYITLPESLQTTEIRKELGYYLDALANDLSTGGNTNILRSARTLRYTNGTYIAKYQDAATREDVVIALDEVKTLALAAIRNQGTVRDNTVVPDSQSVSNPCANVQTTASTLLDIIITTLQGTTNPWVIASNQGFNTANFPTSGEPSELQLQSFNSIDTAGVILPRGVSIIGQDLRKVTIRPTYVPPKDGTEGRAAVFRMTGGNFISGFTILDKEGLEQSHHNLSAFEFCTLTDLDNYYDKIALTFKDAKNYHRLQDAANLIEKNEDWIIFRCLQQLPLVTASTDIKEKFKSSALSLLRAIAKDLRLQKKTNVSSFASDLLVTYINLLSDDVKEFTKTTLIQGYQVVAQYTNLAIINQANTAEGGYRDVSITVDPSSNPCADVQSTITTLVEVISAILRNVAIPALNYPALGIGDAEAALSEYQIVGAVTENSVQDTVYGSSPYLYSVSIRSVWGMCGVDGDGTKVTGFKSYLAAQVTVISLQKDSDAFTTINAVGEVGSKRYKGSKFGDVVDYRHFGFRISADGYAQIATCFAIGPAIHFWASSGAEMSVTGSSSNFGDVSLYSTGYRGQSLDGGAFLQDKGYKIVEIQRPEPIDLDNYRTISVGFYSSHNSNSLTLQNSLNFDDIFPYSIRAGSSIYLDYFNRSTRQVEQLSAVVGPAGVNSSSQNKLVIPVSSFVGSWPSSEDLLGRPISIRRVVDYRNQEDKIYKVIVEAPVGSRGLPTENFILRLDFTKYNQQFAFSKNNVFYVAKSQSIGNSRYKLTLLCAYLDDEGNPSNNLNYYPTVDVDYDPTTQSNLINSNPTDSVTYSVLNSILSTLGYSQVSKDTILVSSQVNHIFPADPDQRLYVEFNKPSVIRCNNHTWEYAGYYNYSTAIPSVQASVLGHSLSELDAAKLKLSKLQSAYKGGRIYATGLNEEGDFFVGTNKTNVKTGVESDIRLLGTPDPDLKTQRKLNISDELKVLPQSSITIQSGASISLESGSSFDVPTVGESAVEGVKAFYKKEQSGEEIRRYGLARPATSYETLNEINTDNSSNFLTPEKLREWANSQPFMYTSAASNFMPASAASTFMPIEAINDYLPVESATQFIGARTTNVPVYIGNWFGIPAVNYDEVYNASYWPEPPNSLIPNSNNPGLVFKPFKTLADAAAWANKVLLTTETIELYMVPGYYCLDASFNCNVILNGAYGQGVAVDPGSKSNASTNSVLLYRNITVCSGISNAGAGRNVGDYALNDIGLYGTFTIKGAGVSQISNVFFVSPIHAYLALKTLSNRSPIEDLLISYFQQSYRNPQSGAAHYVIPSGASNTFENSGWLEKIFRQRFKDPVIEKSAGTLNVENVIFYSQSPYYHIRSAYGMSVKPYIYLSNSASLNGIGCTLRGNEQYIIPRSVDFRAQTSGNQQLYNIGPTTAAGASYNIANFWPPAISWYHYGYTSNVSGTYFAAADTNAKYITVYGFSTCFISTNKGRYKITFFGTRYIASNTEFLNFNDDRNNWRLEGTHFGTQNLNATDRGSATLGVRGAPNASDNTAFVTSLTSTLGPLLETFFSIDHEGANLDISNDLEQGAGCGWRGSFGYIPYRVNYLMQGTAVKMHGLSLAQGQANNIGLRSIMFDEFGDVGSTKGGFWKTAGTDGSTFTICQNSVNRNVMYRRWYNSAYTSVSGLLEGNWNSTSYVKRQNPTAQDDLVASGNANYTSWVVQGTANPFWEMTSSYFILSFGVVITGNFFI